MAIRPDYDLGEVTLSSGSADFTTTGSALQTAAVQAGDAIIAPSGHVLIIATITGQNSGTLFLPCPAAAAGTGLPLRIRFQPDGSRYQGAVRNLIDLLSSGNLEALASLVGADGMVPIFTGPGTLDLADPATFGIQDPNGSLGKLAALTLAANKAITTDGSGNAQQSDLGTLGRALLALATGTSAQYVQGDGTLQAKAGLPVSTATQTALNAKANLNGATFTGNVINSHSNANTISRRPRNNTGTGQSNDGGFLSSEADNASLSAILFCRETVGTGVTAILAVNAGASAAYFTFNNAGAMSVPGALSKGSGTFDIDHPLDPFNKNLVHGFVESTEYMNLYRGMVDLEDGRMIVDIDAAFGMTDGTFEALNADVMVTALQAQYVPERLYVEASPASGKFVIKSENPNSTATVAWMVSGRRQDAFIKSNPEAHTDADGRLVPEYEKEDV